jgi:membrane associated rhomboid family serine protease
MMRGVTVPPSPVPPSGRAPAAPRERSRFTALAVLVALNLGVFFVQVLSAPFDDTLRGSLVEHGGVNGWAVDQGEWWRIITGGFLHSGFAHLLGNLVALLFLGGVLTLAVGPLRMCLVYAAGLLGSSCSILAFAGETLTVGASGAIFGLAGGAVVVGVRQRRWLLLLFAAGWIAYALSSTLFVPGISQAGHLGGLAAGGIAGWLLVDEAARLRNESAAVGMVLLLVALLFGAALMV